MKAVTLAARLGRSGAALMVASSICFAFMGLYVKKVSAAVPVAEVMLVRSVIVGAIAAAIGARDPRALLGRNRRLLFTRSLLGVASMWSYFFAISRLRLGDAVLLQYLAPVFVTLMAPLALHEKASRLQWPALLLGIAGVAVVARPSGGVERLGIAAALASAVLSAGAYVSVRHLARSDGSETIVLWFSALAAAMTGVAAVPVWVTPTPPLARQLCAVGLFAGMAQVLMTRAYAAGQAARVSIYGYATPVMAYLLGQVALHERAGWRGAIGTMLVASAGVLVSLPALRRMLAATTIPP